MFTVSYLSSWPIREHATGRFVESRTPSIVGTEPEALIVLRRDPTIVPIVGYNPDDAERWFVTLEACESARQGISTPTSVAVAGVVHRDC